jgi:hypothetical protein
MYCSLTRTQTRNAAGSKYPGSDKVAAPFSSKSWSNYLPDYTPTFYDADEVLDASPDIADPYKYGTMRRDGQPSITHGLSPSGPQECTS